MLHRLSFFAAILLGACCFYQAVYAGVRLLGKRRSDTAKRPCRYGVLIAARNEEAVIGQLLDSIAAQDYPAHLVRVFVAADNCTDATAETAAAHGAEVFCRRDPVLVGKGYALSFLLKKIEEAHPEERFDGWFVFDADNLLDPRYITEMNKVFSSGKRVVVSCRNSKNFGDNWLSAGYGLWFLRESEFMNRPRDLLGVGCMVNGTGFLFADDLLTEMGGWNFHLLSEDTEFTAELLLRGERAAYCGDAVFYDEQPTGFGQSLLQRARWLRGSWEVFRSRGKDLWRVWRETGRFGCYDLLMNALPALVFTVLGTAGWLWEVLKASLAGPLPLLEALVSPLPGLLASYLAFYFMGLLVILTEHRRIPCSGKKLFLYSFGFPLFLFSFSLAMGTALVCGGDWVPIRHRAALTIRDLEQKP